MSLVVWGALLGGGAGVGLVVSVQRALALRRPRLELRVLPYVRDLPVAAHGPRPIGVRKTSAFVAVFGPTLQSGARALDRVLGGAPSVRRRLERLTKRVTLAGDARDEITVKAPFTGQVLGTFTPVRANSAAARSRTSARREGNWG